MPRAGESPSLSDGQADKVSGTNSAAICLDISFRNQSTGFFLTEQNRFLVTDRETGGYTARGKAIIVHTPMGRLEEPQELLGAVLCCCPRHRPL